MDRELAEAIVEAIENNGGEAELREDYSGRGMYGKTTTGVVFDGDLVSAIINNADLFVEDDDPKFETRSLCEDSMGLSRIIY